MNKENVKGYIKESQELIDEEYRLIEEIAQLRKKSGLTQEEVANMVNIAQSSYARLESKKHSPQLDTIIKIVDAIGYKLELKKKK